MGCDASDFFLSKVVNRGSTLSSSASSDNDNPQWFERFVGDTGHDSYEYELPNRDLNEKIVLRVGET